MKLFVGLGNPGKQYATTLHNLGFLTVDLLADKYNISIHKNEGEGLTGQFVINGQKVLLLKPQTYMNESGRSVASILSYYKIELDDMIVVYDDMDLPLGHLRLRPGGSSGGHNGIKSIIAAVGTDQFKRIRIGIGKDEFASARDHVLSHITKDEVPLFEKAIQQAAAALADSLSLPFSAVMSKYNHKRDTDEDS